MNTPNIPPVTAELLAAVAAVVGFVCVVAGVYLWLGLAAALIVAGVVIAVAGLTVDVGE